jgi:hypothetical protein
MVVIAFVYPCMWRQNEILPHFLDSPCVLSMAVCQTYRMASMAHINQVAGASGADNAQFSK